MKLIRTSHTAVWPNELMETVVDSVTAQSLKTKGIVTVSDFITASDAELRTPKLGPMGITKIREYLTEHTSVEHGMNDKLKALKNLNAATETLNRMAKAFPDVIGMLDTSIKFLGRHSFTDGMDDGVKYFYNTVEKMRLAQVRYLELSALAVKTKEDSDYRAAKAMAEICVKLEHQVDDLIKQINNLEK